MRGDDRSRCEKRRHAKCVEIEALWLGGPPEFGGEASACKSGVTGGLDGPENPRSCHKERPAMNM